MFHKHKYVERYGGLYADEPNGPRTVHEIWWECSCGDVRDKAARQRAELSDSSLSHAQNWADPSDQ